MYWLIFRNFVQCTLHCGQHYLTAKPGEALNAMYQQLSAMKRLKLRQLRAKEESFIGNTLGILEKVRV